MLLRRSPVAQPHGSLPVTLNLSRTSHGHHAHALTGAFIHPEEQGFAPIFFTATIAAGPRTCRCGSQCGGASVCGLGARATCHPHR